MTQDDLKLNDYYKTTGLALATNIFLLFCIPLNIILSVEFFIGFFVLSKLICHELKTVLGLIHSLLELKEKKIDIERKRLQLTIEKLELSKILKQEK